MFGDHDCNQSRRQTAAAQNHDKQDSEVSFDLLVTRAVLRHLERVSLAIGMFVEGYQGKQLRCRAIVAAIPEGQRRFLRYGKSLRWNQ